MITWAVEHGVDLNATNDAGATALQHAKENRDEATVEFLVRLGAV